MPQLPTSSGAVEGGGEGGAAHQDMQALCVAAVLDRACAPLTTPSSASIRPPLARPRASLVSCGTCRMHHGGAAWPRAPKQGRMGEFVCCLMQTHVGSARLPPSAPASYSHTLAKRNMMAQRGGEAQEARQLGAHQLRTH